MLSDFEILTFITSLKPVTKVPLKEALSLLLQTLEWSLPGKKALDLRLKKLPDEQARILLKSINLWRTKSKLSPIKNFSNRLLQVEVAHLAKLKAFHLSKSMARRGSHPQKKRWVLDCLNSTLFLSLSKKTFLGDECLDRILGLNERNVKSELFGKDVKSLYRSEDIYLDLDPEDLFTPYRVLVDISHQLKLKPNEFLIDLGSGLGRVGIVMGLLNPKLKFLGLELMKERHRQAKKAAQKLGIDPRIRFECADLSKMTIPRADCYYLFNPFSYLTLRRVFQELHKNSENKSFKVVMAQVGRPPRMVKRHPWLKQVYLSPIDRNWRAHGYSFYASR